VGIARRARRAHFPPAHAGHLTHRADFQPRPFSLQ
jgi:hypothetical protein